MTVDHFQSPSCRTSGGKNKENILYLFYNHFIYFWAKIMPGESAPAEKAADSSSYLVYT